MKGLSLWLIAFGVILGSCQAQFQGPPPATSAPSSPQIDATLLDSLLHATRPELRFRVDDVLTIEVYGISNYAAGQRVEKDGSIRLPFLEKVPTAGLTVQELEEAVETRLKSEGFVRDPQVTVTTVSQPWAIVTISGNAARPGVFPAYGNLTLMDYLSEAGGIQSNPLGGNSPIFSPASSVVTLIRPSLDHAVTVPLGPDPAHSPYGKIPMFPGDEIRINTVGEVYAVGAFRNQGAYPLKNTSPTTVLQLTALAGGIGYEGDRGDAHIIRTDGEKRFLLDINVAKILGGKAADFPLQPDDILFVPTNQMKAAIKGGGAGLVVSIASAALYNHF